MIARTRFAILAFLALAILPALHAQDAAPNAADEIDWRHGPTDGALGTTATIPIPDGFVFTGREGAQALLRMTQNPVSGAELGIVMPATEQDRWFVVFEFREEGYVSDEDRGELDADALLENIRAGTEAANEERAKEGWPPVETLGWEKPPFYDPKTNNLTWATRLRSEGSESVNWSTRLLGRRGCMNVDLVLSPEELAAVLPRFEALLEGFRFHSGQSYAEFRPGDKVATYGLAALVAGGAGALAAKTGLLAKFWKYLVVAAVALAGFVKKLFGGKSRTQTSEA
jgi:uncharacterized membrane-anchored protein